MWVGATARDVMLASLAASSRATRLRACRKCAPHPPQRRNASGSSASRSDEWETIIGLEIHAQLRTGRKLFSPAALSHNDPPNTHVALHDSAFPGTLPSLDMEAIRLSIMTALALNCSINPRSTFDRKHYFYHDIPASYQITQHYNPLAKHGTLRISQGDNGSKRSFDVGIQQLQVEQDTAKSQTVGSNVLVDLNRAGTGLMEIVTDPDMRSAAEAGAFVRKLQSLLRRVGSGDGDMEKGNLRVDANVSVRRIGQPFGTRCEIKNLNSVRFLQTAIEYERMRHIRHYESSGEPLQQETRGINELTGETYSLRTKEEAEDYRYMPDANLPAMLIDPAYLERLRRNVPEMPWQTTERLVKDYGLSAKDADTLLNMDEYHAMGVRYFEDVIHGEAALGKKASNWIVHELLGQLGKEERPWSPDVIPPGLMRQIVLAVERGDITGTTGKSLLKGMVGQGIPPGSTAQLADLLNSFGLSAATSADDLRAVCQAAIGACPSQAEAIKKGNLKPAMRIVGEVMKRTNGGADAKRAREIILDILRQ